MELKQNGHVYSNIQCFAQVKRWIASFFAILTLAISSIATAGPILTSVTLFSADSSGTAVGGQAWNTQGGDGVWATGVTQPFPSIVNNIADTTVSIPVTGVEDITLLVAQGPFVFNSGDFIGLNVFFDGSTLPDISAVGQVGTSTLLPNASPSTWGYSGFGLVPGSGSLSYTGLGGETVDLTSLDIPLFDPAIDFVGTGETPGSFSPNGAGDGVVNITLTPGKTSMVPLPAALWFFTSGLIGLIGIARKRKAT